MRKTLLFASLAACAALVLTASTALAADNWLGTWKLNVEKSKFSPGPAPKSLTLKFEAAEGGLRLSSDGVNAQGNPTKGGYASKFDGTETPFEGNPDAETAAPKRIDANTYENIWKKAGKVTVTTKGVVSKDGKTLTITQAGKNAKGETVSTTAVYDRQ